MIERTPLEQSHSQRVKELFDDLRVRSADDQARVLSSLRQDPKNAAVADEVELFLAALLEAGEFLESPTGGGGSAADEASAPNDDDGPQDGVPGLGETASQIGPYKLLRQLGEGGFGLVYLAEQQQPIRRQVALKVIKPGMDTRQVLARFAAERQALALMDHPSIARVIDAGSTPQGRPFFAMELVDGVSITRFCDEERLSIRQRLGLFRAVCDAVQHAHQKGVIHRDLKPSNILITVVHGKPLPKIIDFGILKAIRPSNSPGTLITEIGQLIGTPEYMSPEQADPKGNHGADIDTRSDIYSLGVLLYQLLTGTTPAENSVLRAAALAEVQRMIREVEPPRPSTRLSLLANLPAVAAARRVDSRRLTSMVHGDLDWIVMKCLEKERSRRYETAEALSSDLGRFLAGEPVLAAPPSRAYRTKKLVLRNRLVITLAGAGAMSLLAITVGVGWGMMVAIHQRDRALEAQHGMKLAQEAETQQRRRAEQREQDAHREAERARSLAQFLQSMLLSADPNRAGIEWEGREMAVHEVVDRASARLDKGSLEGEPALELTIRTTLGDVYRGLGLYDSASSQYTRASALATDVYGEDHVEQALVLRRWGELHREQAEHPEAVRMFRQALTIYQSSGPDFVHPATVTAGELATALTHGGHIEEADAMLAGVIPALRDQDDVFPLVKALNSLSFVRLSQGRPAEAIAALREAYLLQRTTEGATPQVAILAGNLAQRLADAGEFDEAEQLMQEAIQMQEVLYGESHFFLISTLESLGLTRSARGGHAEAESLLRRAVDIATENLPPDHQDTIRAMQNLGFVLRQAGNDAEAEPWFRQALEASSESTHYSVRAMIASNLSDILLRDGRLEEAERLTLLSVETIRNAGIRGNELMSALGSHAAVLSALGRRQEAIPLLREAAAAGRESLGPSHPYLGLCLYNLAQTLHLTMDPEHFAEADSVYKEMIGIFEGASGYEQLLAMSCANYGVLLVRIKEYEGAEIMLRRGLALQRTAFEEGSPHIASTLDSLGRLYHMLGRYAEAEPALTEALEMRERLFGKYAMPTSEMRIHLARCLIQLARSDEAAAHLRECLNTPDATPMLVIVSTEELTGVLIQTQEFQEAATLLQDLIAATPAPAWGSPAQEATAHAQLGVALAGLERWTEAEAPLAKALALRKTFAPEQAWMRYSTQSLLGQTLAALGRSEEAEEHLLESAESISPPADAAASRREAVDRLVKFYEQQAAAGGESTPAVQEKLARWRTVLDGLRPE